MLLLKIVIYGVIFMRSRAVSHDRNEPTNQHSAYCMQCFRMGEHTHVYKHHIDRFIFLVGRFFLVFYVTCFKTIDHNTNRYKSFCFSVVYELGYYRDCAVPYVRHFHMGYGKFHCDLMKGNLTLHWITIEYAVSCMKIPHVRDCTISVITARLHFALEMRQINALALNVMLVQWNWPCRPSSIRHIKISAHMYWIFFFPFHSQKVNMQF